MIYIYPAKFIKENNGYSIDFIDLVGCSTQGNSLEEAYEMAKEAMALYLEDVKLKELPKPTLDFKNIKLKDGDFITLIELDLNEYRLKHSNKSVKKTLTIPSWLNKLAESQNLNFSQILQDSLKQKLDIK